MVAVRHLVVVPHPPGPTPYLDTPPPALSDPERLAALRRTALLDTPPEEPFDRLTRVAARVLGAPATFLALVDEDRDFYKSCHGFPEPLASARELAGPTFCHYTIQGAEPLVIPDTLADPVYRRVPTVESLGVRAYLGVPLVTADGHAVGSFCAMDLQPRRWTDDEVQLLVELAASAMREIELRELAREAGRAEAVLRESERRTRALLESAPLIMWTNHPDGRVAHFNRLWYAHTGRSPEESEGSAWVSAVHPADLPALRGAREHGIAAGAAYEIEFRLEGRDGDFRWHRGRVVPLRSPEGELEGWIGSAADVHDIREAEREAREAVRQRDDVLGVVSHDLRNPVHTAFMSTSLLLDLLDEGDSIQRKQLGIIKRATERMNRLIGDLLDVTRIDAGNLHLYPSPLDPADVLREVREIFEPQAAEKSLELEVEIPDGLPPVSADPERVLQVFSNLLGNALKFTPAGGRIAVRAGPDPAGVCFAVSDTGPGIPAADLPHVFDRFWQARQTARDGAGLGLPITRGIVEAHGGTIRAESTPGVGTTFSFTLPSA